MWVHNWVQMYKGGLSSTLHTYKTQTIEKVLIFYEELRNPKKNLSPIRTIVGPLLITSTVNFCYKYLEVLYNSY